MQFDDFWQDLYAVGAEVVLNGDQHHCERFGPQNPNGRATPQAYANSSSAPAARTMHRSLPRLTTTAKSATTRPSVS